MRSADGVLGLSMSDATRERVILSYCVLYSGVYFLPNFLPLLTEVFMHRAHVTASRAGWTLASYMGAMSLAALGVSPIVHKISNRHVSMASLALQVLGYLTAAAAGDHLAVIVIGLFLAGFGNGAVFAIVNASAARERHSALLYGAGGVASCLFAAAVSSLFNSAVVRWGVAGAFAIPLTLVPALIIASTILPFRIDRFEGGAVGPERIARAPIMRYPALLLMMSILLSNVSQMAFYPFGGVLLARAGYDDAQVAGIFTGLFFVAAAGSLLSCALAKWQDYVTPALMATTAALAATILVATKVHTPYLVAGAVSVEAAMAMLIMPVQFAVAAAIDKPGRIAAAASGVLFLSWTLGPALGGWLVENFSFAGLADNALIMGGVALLLAVLLSRQCHRSGEVQLDAANS